MVRFEIEKISNGYLVKHTYRKKISSMSTNTEIQTLFYKTLQDCIKYLQSFVEKGELKQEYKVRMGNSETPKHPYDRDERYWTDELLQDELKLQLTKKETD